MHVPSRASVIACGLLAVLTPAVAGRVDAPFLHDLLSWPVLLLGALPGRAGTLLAHSAFLVLLMHFASYLLADQCLGVLRGRDARLDPPAP